MLISPKIVGPVTELSREITVSRLMPNATVVLLINGSQLGLPTVSSGTKLVIPIEAGVLAESDQLVASQNISGEGSVSRPVIVNSGLLPRLDLPPVVFLSGIHTCIDWILVGGLIVGTSVEIFHNDDVIGTAIASAPTARIQLSFQQPFEAGQQLRARQSITFIEGPYIESPEVFSLPADPSPIHRGNIPAVWVDTPQECSSKVRVHGLIEGASLTVEHQGNTYNYAVVATSMSARLGTPLSLSETISAKQDFKNCGFRGSFFTPPVNVGSANKPGVPIPKPPLYHGSPNILVYNLVEGAILYLQIVTINSDGSEIRLLDPICGGISDEVDLIPIPEGWHYAPPPSGRVELRFWQEFCGHKSDESRLPFQALPTSTVLPEIETPLVECQRFLWVENTLPGTTLIVRSNAPDGKELSEPHFADASTLIYTHRPLRAREEIWVEQLGGGSTTSQQVQSLPYLEQPNIPREVSLPQGGVVVDAVTIGAQVHVYVNSIRRVSMDVIEVPMFVQLTDLKLEDSIHVIQTMCTAISESSEKARVVHGKLLVEVHPDDIERNRPSGVTIFASDSETHESVAGTVHIGGAVVGQTEQLIPVFFSNTIPPAFVRANGYSDEPIPWRLIEPRPQSPGKLTLRIGIDSNNEFRIVSVSWSLLKYDAMAGTNFPFSSVKDATGQLVQFTLPSPDPGQSITYAVSCQVIVAYKSSLYQPEGTQVLASIRSPGVAGVENIHSVEWHGNDVTANFRLLTEPTYINNHLIDVEPFVLYVG